MCTFQPRHFEMLANYKGMTGLIKLVDGWMTGLLKNGSKNGYRKTVTEELKTTGSFDQIYVAKIILPRIFKRTQQTAKSSEFENEAINSDGGHVSKLS